MTNTGAAEKLVVELDQVPETLLWTLYHRAVEARRADAVLDDPLAVELVDTIDYPFVERFGSGEAFSQWQALRARCFDSEVSRFLADEPGGTVVALGEGLETQFWRVDNGRVRWLTVDLPEVVELRRRLLPESSRLRMIGCSAVDAGLARGGRRRTGSARDRAGAAHVSVAGRRARARRALRRRVPRRTDGVRCRARLARRAKSKRSAEVADRVRAAGVVVGIR